MSSIQLFFALITMSSMLKTSTEDTTVSTTIDPIRSIGEFCGQNHFEYIYVNPNNKLVFMRNVSTANEHRLYHKWTAGYDPIAGNLTDVQYQQKGFDQNEDQNRLKNEVGTDRTPYDLVNSNGGSEAYWKPLMPSTPNSPIPDSNGLFFRSILHLNETNERFVVTEKLPSKEQYIYRLDSLTLTPTGKTVLKFFGCYEPTVKEEMSMFWTILTIIFAMIFMSIVIVIIILFFCREKDDKK